MSAVGWFADVTGLGPSQESGAQTESLSDFFSNVIYGELSPEQKQRQKEQRDAEIEIAAGGNESLAEAMKERADIEAEETYRQVEATTATDYSDVGRIAKYVLWGAIALVAVYALGTITKLVRG